MILVDLGSTDEEKFMNIQSIKKIRNWFKKLVKFEFIIAAILFFMMIISGSVEVEGLGIIGALLLFAFMLGMGYLMQVYIYGTMFAWGMFVIDKKKFMENMPEPVSTEEIVRAYCIGGHEYAQWVSLTDFSLVYIFICFCIGIWLGAINAIIKYPECKAVEKRMKDKYQSQGE